LAEVFSIGLTVLSAGTL